jgi:hypothetical protein
MTFSLPEIQISSSNLYTALKIIFLVTVFVVIVFNVISVSALPENIEYEFVYCPDPGTGGTITYPPGTECEVPNELKDDDKEEDEEKEDEREHQQEEEEDDN